MFTKIIKSGVGHPYDLFVATMNRGGNEHTKGAVSLFVGEARVTIRSNVPTWGSIPVEGRENLKLLRDALIRICKIEKIK